MKRFLLLLCLLALMPLCASAVVTVPSGVTEVEAEAFAGTAIDALIVPASVNTVGSGVLSGSGASYIYLQSAATTLESGANEGVPFVFAPADSSAASLDGFYAIESLVTDSGLYYAVGGTAIPLCAKSPKATTGSVTIPKLLDGVPVPTLEELYIANTGITELRIPRYLTAPDGVTSTTYETMTVAAPVASTDETPAGKYVTWTTEGTSGEYGDVTYTWTFTIGSATASVVTTEPTVKYAPMAEGECIATVRAEDSLGDWAEANSEPLTVTAAEPVYRALLVGNTYSGASNELKGPENDLVALSTVLNTMGGTPYKITKASNLTATGMQAAIASTFSGAEPGDFSIFYFSGHGTSTGSLVGTNNTYLTVYTLRTALDKIPGTKIVILDCCYSGNAINRSTGDETSVDLSAFNRALISGLTSQSRSSENLADGGYIVLTACSKDQTSVSLTGDNSYYWGAFTYGLCYGSGYDEWNRTVLGYLPADTSGDGVITLTEAYQGILERVTYLNTITYVEQAVQYHGDGAFVLWAQ